MLWDELLRPQVLARTTWEWNGSDFSKGSYGEMVAKARRSAAALRERGVGPGSIVAAVLTNGIDVIPGYLGAWFAGATVASLPIVARGMSIPRYVEQLDELCAAVGAQYLLAEERFLGFMSDDNRLKVKALGYRGLIENATSAPLEPPDPEGPIFIQFSSGTTGEPRGVELTGTAIEMQLQTLAERISIDTAHDYGYMWLPMSHDMGFFGCFLLSWFTGIGGAKGTPERFLQSPRTWLDDCARFGATVTAGPPFALSFAARAERRHSASEPVKIRLCLVGAEHIEWSSLADAAQVFAPRGLTLQALTPAYGLAEATLAVTVDELERAPKVIDLDPDALVAGEIRIVDPDLPTGRRLVSAGTPLPGSTVRRDSGTGEIVVTSASLASGYFGNPEATGERFRDGELWTRDLGFVHDGELFITGRSDDTVNVGGRNVYVQDLESRLSAEAGIRRGNLAIVSNIVALPGRVGAVAELETDSVDARDLAVRLRRATMSAIGLPLSEFVFVPRGAFPKTPSGKVQRFRCRELLAKNNVGHRVTLGMGTGDN
jgi:fatty-acyl-CoA synthase